MPPNPGASLAVTARNHALDRLRRERTLTEKTRLLEPPSSVEDDTDATTFPDERPELISPAAIPPSASRPR